MTELKEIPTDELVKELAGREKVKMYAHKFHDEEFATIEILFETNDESFFSLPSRQDPRAIMKSEN